MSYFWTEIYMWCSRVFLTPFIDWPKLSELAPVSWTPDSWGCRALSRESTCRIPSRRTHPSSGLRRSASHAPRATPIRSVAMDLGISNESLRRWVLQADIDRGESPGLSSDERAELTRLRRENRTLRIEREILNRAAAFFARETDETR